MGRGTAEEEAKRYLAGLGVLNPEEILDGLKDRSAIEVPDNPEDLLREFTEALYLQMKLGELKSTALVQGLKAVSILAEAAKRDEPPVEGPERGIDEILADAGLPLDRRLEIGKRELERLRAREKALAAVVDGLEAT